MKTLIIPALVSSLLLSSCYHEPQSTVVTDNEIKIEFLFEHEGIRMYRFNDGHYHYFTSQGTTITSQPNGKSSYEEIIVPPIDTTEKHFDCRAVECEPTRYNRFWVTTECGILFNSPKSYEKGEVIPGFTSPKHK